MKTTIAILLLALSGFAYAKADDSTMAGDSSSIARGKVVYGKYCSKCHGKNADGRGKKAYKYKPEPTNFHISQAARPYIVEIIKKGGKGVGRSDDMPDWDGDLSKKQINDVVNYVMSVRNNH
jgi:mono/diheme cytochrome c family protein